VTVPGLADRRGVDVPKVRRTRAETVATGALPGIRPEESGEGRAAEEDSRPPVPDYKRGVPCPACSRLSLVGRQDPDRVECSFCGHTMTVAEYGAYAKSP
jgi:hypothetical protein